MSLNVMVYVPCADDGARFSFHFSSLLQNRELQIMRKLDHCNIVRLRYFFYSSGDKVTVSVRTRACTYYMLLK